MPARLKFAQYLEICNKIQNSKFLSSIFMPLANWAQNSAGYRRLGLKYDDLIMDDNELAQEALSRLPKHELNQRVYRHRRAFQLSVQQAELPKEEWLKSQDDNHYLLPLLAEVEKEFDEKAKYDNLVYSKKK